ncbi:hypothetical protein IWQ57_004446, partial [Coemansia nantahalensis]
MRFAMPRLDPSPAASAEDLAGLGTQARCDPAAVPGERSRLHRRLSMEMMRQECARLGRRTEKQIRAADNADNGRSRPDPKPKGPAPSSHGDAETSVAARQPPGAEEPPADVEQRPSNRAPRHTWHAAPGGFTTLRLIGPVAADAGGAVRASHGTQFPELQGHRARGRARLSGLVSKGTQPLLDMLHRAPAPADPAKGGGTAPPTRIPGIRPPKQQQQPVDDDWEMVPPGPSAATSDRRAPAASRPLPNAQQSQIPLPPNARSRAASPTGADEHGRGPSNVFLRLARRLNGTRGQPGEAAALGTMPRKMDMLLPAAQFMSQQSPKRQPTPQAQVFYTRPAVAESAARKPTPPRRHSYQVAPDEGPDDQGAPRRAREPRPPRTPRTKPPAGDDDDMPENDDYLSPRGRSATVSQMSRQTHSAAGGPAREQPVPPQRQVSATQAGAPAASEAGDSLGRKQSVSLRPSSLIPSLTRRLGLGFGSKPNPPAASTGAATGGRTGAGDGPGRRPGSRVVSSSSNKGALSERVAIPPRLSIDSVAGTAARPTSRRASRRMSRWAADRDADLWDADEHNHSPHLAAPGSLSSYSMQISIDSSSDSDGALDVDDRAIYAHSIHRAPSSAGPRSYLSSRRLDERSGEFDPADPHSAAAVEHLLSSPVRPLARQRAHSQQLLSPGADGGDGAPRAGTRGMLSLLHHQHSYRHRSSSAEDDDLDTHEPDLHFGQSDTASDGEQTSAANSHAVGSVASPPG